MTTTAVETPGTEAARPARWRRVVVGAVAVAVVVGTGTGIFVRQESRIAAVERLGEASAAFAGRVRDLAIVTAAGRQALAASSGRVDDETVRDDLSEALADASTATRVSARTPEEYEAAGADVDAAGVAVSVAAAAVTGAVSAWELARANEAYEAAAAALDTAVAAAGVVLDSSAGRVADESVRSALSTAIDAAEGVRDDPRPSTADGLHAAADDMSAAADQLAGPREEVTTAVAAWEAAQAAAAQAAASRPAGISPSGTQSRGTTSSGSSGEGHWQETVTYEDLHVCMDTEGNSWEC